MNVLKHWLTIYLKKVFIGEKKINVLNLKKVFMGKKINVLIVFFSFPIKIVSKLS